MGPSQDARAGGAGRTSLWVVALDLTAKVLLLVIVALVALDPAWGNLEGKAPGTRAVTYPMLAFVVPVAYLARRPDGGYPWVADLLLTVPSFSDVLGNRLDLYDRVVWFDDFMHFANAGLVSAAVLLLSGVAAAPLRRRLAVAVAAGMTASLAWEVWEYFAFVTSSSEVGSAYADTVGDLALGWGGAFVAGAVVGVGHRTGMRRVDDRDAAQLVETVPSIERRLARRESGGVDAEATLLCASVDPPGGVP